jgi:pimeloyl-ACP methyl ester carboxylesterase
MAQDAKTLRDRDATGLDPAAPVVVVEHFGGNGHCDARVEGVVRALERTGGAIRLRDVSYPGFEGRPPAASLDEFLDGIAAARADATPPASAVAASGIGALIALTLRARGRLEEPLFLQAPVLWGLERRRMPRVMRWRFPRALLTGLFRVPAFQRRFARKQFRAEPSPEFLSRFFAGYARCRAFGSLFTWFTPEHLRTLEGLFRAHPERLGRVEVWWGGHDAVVSEAELDATAAALGVRWPLRRVPDWGHYPMIDDPDGWVEVLRDALATARPLS